jgi:hypothetical protein
MSINLINNNNLDPSFARPSTSCMIDDASLAFVVVKNTKIQRAIIEKVWRGRN